MKLETLKEKSNERKKTPQKYKCFKALHFLWKILDKELLSLAVIIFLAIYTFLLQLLFV